MCLRESGSIRLLLAVHGQITGRLPALTSTDVRPTGTPSRAAGGAPELVLAQRAGLEKQLRRLLRPQHVYARDGEGATDQLPVGLDQADDRKAEGYVTGQV